MITEHIFISDVHLGAFSQETNSKIEQDLIKLVRYCTEHRIKINILGDLFDYWMEFPEKNFIPALGSGVLKEFERYNKEITSTLYITGNHDNWTFGHFEDCGFDVEENFRLVEIQGTRVLMMHGDGVAASKIDFPRAVFHRLLRNPEFINVYQKVFTPERGLATMKAFSNFTRQRNNHNPEPLNRQAKKIFDKHNLDYIISGHDHVPRIETFSQGNYINLGAFFNNRTLALYNNKGLNLVKWKAESNSFIPFSGNQSKL
ncbi:MAG: metallophosphoesterase [Gracilimonas sp.]|nr:metallophosphoesterase [Gracilimonas sp.]